MSKLTVTSIGSIYLPNTIMTINNNFQAIIDELQNKILYRNNPVGEPNQMENTLDMNSNRILNLPEPSSSTEPARLIDIQNVIQFAYKDFINVKNYGAIGDGVANDTAAIQACIEANPARRIFMPKGIYCVDATIWNKYDGTLIEGETVGAYTFTQTDGTYGTTIKWIGSSGGTVVKVARFNALTEPWSFSGGGLKNIRIDCASIAGTGLYIPDANNCDFRNIKIDKATEHCLDLTGYVPDVGGLNSVYNCKFDNIQLTTSGNATGIFMGETPNAGGGDHPAFCKFTNIHITYGSNIGGTGIDIYEADDCHFDTVGISRYAGLLGDAIVLQGSEASGNIFTNINAGYTITSGEAIPKIWAKSGVRACLFTHAGIDDQIDVTIDSGAEVYSMYLGTNVASNTAKFRSPAIQLPNVANADPLIFDWYQEGFFTPVLNFGGATTGITYSQVSGRYTRKGNEVTCKMYFTLSSKGTATGGATITGLPFTSNAANNTFTMIRPVGGFGVGIDKGIGISVGASVTNAALLTNGVGAMTQINDTHFTNTAQIVATFTYEV